MREAGLTLVNPPRYGPLTTEELVPLLEGIDAVLASMDPFTPAVLEAAPARHLKIISRWGVGYDAIDVPAATRLGIVVAFTPGLLNDAVADYTFALLLALARRVHEAHADMRQGGWHSLFGDDIAGKTLGLVGCGRIGRVVAERAGGFRMRVLGCDTAPRPAEENPGVRFVSLEDLLQESDFVSLHAALTPQSRGLIGSAQLRRMKKSAYLVNTARGALVNETALLQALREGWISGAALDAYATEPLPPDHPLRSAPNVLLSPHHASFGRDTGERVSLAAAQAIIDLSNGQPPQMLVNPGVLQSAALRASLR